MTKLTEAEEEKEKAKKMIQLKEEIQNTKIAIHRWKVCVVIIHAHFPTVVLYLILTGLPSSPTA